MDFIRALDVAVAWERTAILRESSHHSRTAATCLAIAMERCGAAVETIQAHANLTPLWATTLRAALDAAEAATMMETTRAAIAGFRARLDRVSPAPPLIPVSPAPALPVPAMMIRDQVAAE